MGTYTAEYCLLPSSIYQKATVLQPLSAGYTRKINPTAAPREMVLWPGKTPEASSRNTFVEGINYFAKMWLAKSPAREILLCSTVVTDARHKLMSDSAAQCGRRRFQNCSFAGWFTTACELDVDWCQWTGCSPSAQSLIRSTRFGMLGC